MSVAEAESAPQMPIFLVGGIQRPSLYTLSPTFQSFTCVTMHSCHEYIHCGCHCRCRRPHSSRTEMQAALIKLALDEHDTGQACGTHVLHDLGLLLVPPPLVLHPPAAQAQLLLSH